MFHNDDCADAEDGTTPYLPNGLKPTIRDKLTALSNDELEIVKEALLEWHDVTLDPDVAELIEFLYGED